MWLNCNGNKTKIGDYEESLFWLQKHAKPHFSTPVNNDEDKNEGNDFAIEW